MPEPETEDDELMARIQGGRGARREEAFRTLVRRHAGSVQALVRSVSGREGAEDVTQEVFLRVYQARERYAPGPAQFRTWLLRIARNAALNARRHRSVRRAGSLDEAGELSVDEPGPARVLEERLEAEAVRAAVERLPAGEREMIALRFGQGLSYEEIGAVTGSGAAALKQKTWRALERLRGLLGTDGGARGRAADREERS
jgi:RNA polymerase sigma-70 factor (ECF subfamily)